MTRYTYIVPLLAFCLTFPKIHNGILVLPRVFLLESWRSCCIFFFVPWKPQRSSSRIVAWDRVPFIPFLHTKWQHCYFSWHLFWWWQRLSRLSPRLFGWEVLTFAVYSWLSLRSLVCTLALLPSVLYFLFQEQIWTDVLHWLTSKIQDPSDRVRYTQHPQLVVR